MEHNSIQSVGRLLAHGLILQLHLFMSAHIRLIQASSMRQLDQGTSITFAIVTSIVLVNTNGCS